MRARLHGRGGIRIRSIWFSNCGPFKLLNDRIDDIGVLCMAVLSHGWRLSLPGHVQIELVLWQHSSACVGKFCRISYRPKVDVEGVEPV